MRLKMISCEVLARQVYYVSAFSPHVIDVELVAKGLHLIVANDVTAPGSGFGHDTNQVKILHRDGTLEDLPLMSKEEVARQLLDRILKIRKG